MARLNDQIVKDDPPIVLDDYMIVQSLCAGRPEDILTTEMILRIMKGSNTLFCQIAGGKHSRQEKGSSSRSGITLSKSINPQTLSYPVLDLFAHTSLTFILTLTCPFNFKLLYQFFASFRINTTYTSLQSYVNKRPVELTYQDFEEILHLSTTGDKLQANHFLQNTAAPFHVGVTSSLGKDARTIQHVLRSSVIPKAGDRIHITPLLSLTTFYIMANREFNASDLIICYIEHLTTIRDAGHRRKPNLALGHIISYALETKHNLQFSAPPNYPDTPPTFFKNNSFNILHSTRLLPDQGEAREEEEEDLPEQMPHPIPAPIPLRQYSQIDQLVESRVDDFIVEQRQHNQRFYEYLAQQQHTQDKARLTEQFDILLCFHPPPPPPPPPEDDDPFSF
ncbi:hypothetical protein M5K25_011025 [Dendrobium thyrsiflorum]|uniref:Uncharacterized protein n=1 Tax=Dendrobium thyrsiflorum TaxID=117978 RepID=A0ABD0V8M0_DENTH